MPKLTLKLVIAPVGKRDLPAPPVIPPNTLGDLIVGTDDITEIDGDTSLRGEHSGFCFRVREPNIWLCQAGYTLPGIKKRHFRKGGQIEARGILDFSAPNPKFVAITGGTGDYGVPRARSSS